MKKKHRFFNKGIGVMIAVGILVVVTLICLVLDYYDVPSMLGINTNVFNLDFWSIFLGNGIVITLFIVTFFLFDKKNLQKERLADYAGVVSLLDTYLECESFIKIIQGVLAGKVEKMQPKVSEYIYNGPFKNDDKIFELLQGGHISKDSFEKYSYVKSQYKVLAYTVTEMKGQQEFASKLLKEIIQQIKEEKEKLQAYKESLK